MKLNTLGLRLGLSYFLLLLVIVGIVVVSVFEMRDVSSLSSRLQTLRAPTTVASAEMLTEVNRSFASLRGWMILGQPKFKNERTASWKKMEAALAKMEKLSESWTNPKTVKRLAVIKKKLVQFKKAQQEVEAIANTPENLPALQLLLKKAAPLGDQMGIAITQLIDLEKKEPATSERKRLLGAIADFRGSLGLGLANVRAYLLTGQKVYEQQFLRFWDINVDSYAKLFRMRSLMTKEQQGLLEELQGLRKAFSPLPSKLFQIRAGKQWNKANFWLGTRAEPIAADLVASLEAMSLSQRALMTEDFHTQAKKMRNLLIVEWVLLALAALISLLLAWFMTRTTTKPITAAMRAAERISRGDYEMKEPITGFAEANALGESFGKMSGQVEKQISEHTDELKQQNWVKSHVATISEILSKSEDITALAQQLVSELAEVLKAGCIVFYVNLQPIKDESGEPELHLYAAYGYKKRKHIDTVVKPGEGLVGQCLLEKKPITLTDVPEDYIQIKSGLGSKAPANLYLIPILFNEHVLGVLEIASFHEFTTLQQELVDAVADTAGINLSNVMSTETTRTALEKSQQLSQELQAQQEELRTTNDELENKTSILKSSEAELKAQSEEMMATNEELEEKTQYLEQQKANIEKKNAAIEEAKEELEIKAKDLSLASKYKSEFLANMSHELRTPLNSLLILSKSLADNDEGNLTDDQVEEATVIHGGGQELLHLINDILDLSKVESGKMDVQIETEEVSSIVEALKTQFEPLARDKKITFSPELDSSLPQVIDTDAQRVGQILKNLLSNAFKFTKEGSVKLRVYRPVADRDVLPGNLKIDASVAFAVVDSGIGISDEDQHAIFEAFQQADGSTSRQYGGTGLGLTISREMAHLLGGDITLSSKVGQGSQFTLYLPLKYVVPKATDAKMASPPRFSGSASTTHAKPLAPEVKRQSNAGSSEGRVKGKNNELAMLVPDDRETWDANKNSVLIIEDDLKFAAIVQKLARTKGYQSVIAATGSQGLQHALKFLPSAIILDLTLPDMDGHQVLEQLKYNLETRHIPVHIVSGRDRDPVLLQLGAVGYLTKPATQEGLDNIFSKFESLADSAIKYVLVVEDDSSSQLAIKKLISHKGVEIDVAENGAAAQERIKAQRYDCIILDLGLPDMTGFALLKLLAKTKDIVLPPVVVYTGKALSEEEYQELSAYGASVVVKGADSPDRLLDETSLFLHSVEKDLPANQQEMIRQLHDPDTALKSRKLLLVDDDMRNLFALSKLLEKQGLIVSVAANGQLALDKLQEEDDIELVLMDIMMPVLDGYETIKKIRAMPDFKKLPIIALTAKAMAEDKDKCLASGANDYLMKPVDAENLISMVRVWMGQG